MRLNTYPRPIVPFLLSFLSGILLGSTYPNHLQAGLGTLVLSALWIIRQFTGEKSARFSPVIFFFCLGYLSVHSWVVPRFPPHHVVNFVNTGSMDVVGTVASMPLETNRRVKFVLKAEGLKQNGLSYPVAGRIQVTVLGRLDSLFPGDSVSFTSSIRPLRNFNNPGGFDYKRYMAFRKIWVSAYTSADRVRILSQTKGKGIQNRIEAWRQHIARLIETTVDGEEQKSLIKALIVGYRHAVSKELRETFNRTGIGHLLAISGLHVGIVASVAFLLFSRLLSCLRLFLWNAWTLKGAGLLSMLPVFIYGLLAGLSPSTQRAVIMVTVFLATFLMEREQDPLNTLALAAMIILIAFPPAVFSISFQLSFAAVFFIIYGLNRMGAKKPGKNTHIRTGWIDRLTEKLVIFFWVSFLATFGTLPLIMYYFNQVSLVGIFANVIFIPLVGFLVVPLGLFGVFLCPMSAGLAGLLFKGCAILLTPALSLAHFFADLPFASLKTITPSCFEIVCYYVLFWALLNLRQSPSGISEEPKSHFPVHENVSGGNRTFMRTDRIRSLRYRPIKIIIAVVLLAVCMDVVYWVHQRFWHKDLRITIIDVGQGSAALLEMPGGHCALIDGGGFPDNSVFDVGASVVAPFLWRKKIGTLDLLILSHPNSDHLNGLLYIAEHFKVKTLWANGETENTRAYEGLVSVVKHKEIDMPEFKDFSRDHTINGVKLFILYPPRDFLEKRETEKWRTPNNNSMVVKVQFGSTSFLFPGDIMEKAEKELILTNRNALQSTLLVAPHHGSKSSSSGPFLDTVMPEYVIISSGLRSRSKFPHPSVLKRYEARGFKVFRTDTHGALRISTDGRTITIEPTVKALSQNHITQPLPAELRRAS